MMSKEQINCEIYVKNLATEVGFENFHVQLHQGDKTGFLGEIFRVKVTGTNNGKIVTLHIVSKNVPHSFAEVDDWICERYRVEALVYDKILKCFDDLQNKSSTKKKFKHVKVYKTILESKKEAILMEDVSINGFRNCDLGNVVDLEHAELIINELARFHSLSFAMKFLTPDNYEELTKDISECFFVESSQRPTKKIIVHSIRHASEIVLDAESKEKLFQLENEISENYLTMIQKAINANSAVVCHGDLWTNNILFKYSESKIDEVIFIDWQTVRKSPPVLDLIFFLIISVNENILTTKFQHLLDTYYNNLCYSLREFNCDPDKIYTYVDFRQDLEEFTKLALTQAIIMMPLFTSKPEDCGELLDLNRDDVKAIIGSPIHSDLYMSQVRAGLRALIKQKII